MSESRLDPVYVVAGAVRIQQWIARTPELALSRGASRALAKRTGGEQITRHLDASVLSGAVEVARDAPDVDGVVALKVASASDRDVNAAVGWLRRHLGEHLPGVEWKLWAHQASNYVSAFEAASGSGALSHGRWHQVPASIEVVMAAACGGCRQESALLAHPELRNSWIPSRCAGCGEESESLARRLPGDDPLTALGLDCLVRRGHTAGETESRAWTFDKLARSGGVDPSAKKLPQTLGRRAANNHLATIAADGNRVGALFKSLAKIPAEEYKTAEGRTSTIHQEISAQLHDAAKAAVDTASAVGDPNAPYLCSIDHVVGGDDVLVSVSARFAWRYVRVLLGTFDRSCRDGMHDVIVEATGAGKLSAAAAAELAALVDKVSLSVGVAFANRKHPFAHCTEMAQQALSEAKRRGEGEPAVCWLDLTVESSVPRGRWLAASALSVEPIVAALPPSARATLAALIRDGWLSPPVPEEPEDFEKRAAAIWGEVQVWSGRTGHDDVLRQFEAFGADSLELLRRLECDLDLARWWHIEEQPEA